MEARVVCHHCHAQEPATTASRRVRTRDVTRECEKLEAEIAFDLLRTGVSELGADPVDRSAVGQHSAVARQHLSSSPT